MRTLAATKRAGIYTRLSLDRDGTAESPARQEAACRAVCEQRGWDVADVYCDRDVSAYAKGAKRPEFDRLLADLAAGLLDVIVVLKLDRLTRGGLTGAGKVLERLEEVGATLVSVTEPIDTTTALGEGMFGWLAAQAKQESQNTSMRVRLAQEDAAKRGRPHGGSRCFGYKKTKQGTEIVLEEAKVIREAAARVAAGESLRRLAFELNDRGVRTTQGNEWTSRTLGKMLQSPKLRAARGHNGEFFPGTWDPILSEREHLALVEVLSDPRRLSKQRAIRRHLLSGIAVCGLCGGALKTMGFRMKNGKKFERYQCVRQPGEPNCGKVAASKNALDKHVMGDLMVWALAGKPQEPVVDEAERQRLETLLADDRQGLEELSRDRFFHRTVTAEQFTDTQGLLVERIGDTEATLAALDKMEAPLELPVTYGELSEWLKAVDVVGRRQVVQSFIRQVRVHPARRRGGNIWDRDRAEIVWR